MSEAKVQPGRRGFMRRFGLWFAAAIISGAAGNGVGKLVENWGDVIAALESVGFEEPPAGAEGDLYVFLEWKGEAIDFHAIGGWGEPGVELSGYVEPLGLSDELAEKFAEKSPYLVIDRLIRLANGAPTPDHDVYGIPAPGWWDPLLRALGSATELTQSICTFVRDKVEDWRR